MKKSNLKKLKKLVEHKGDDGTLLKLAEECLELSLAITHYLSPTKLNKKKRLDDVYREAADVKVAFRQLEMVLSRNKINRYANEKIRNKHEKYCK